MSAKIKTDLKVMREKTVKSLKEAAQAIEKERTELDARKEELDKFEEELKRREADLEAEIEAFTKEVDELEL